MNDMAPKLQGGEPQISLRDKRQPVFFQGLVGNFDVARDEWISQHPKYCRGRMKHCRVWGLILGLMNFMAVLRGKW